MEYKKPSVAVSSFSSWACKMMNLWKISLIFFCEVRQGIESKACRNIFSLAQPEVSF